MDEGGEARMRPFTVGCVISISGLILLMLTGFAITVVFPSEGGLSGIPALLALIGTFSSLGAIIFGIPFGIIWEIYRYIQKRKTRGE